MPNGLERERATARARFPRPLWVHPCSGLPSILQCITPKIHTGLTFTDSFRFNDARFVECTQPVLSAARLGSFLSGCIRSITHHMYTKTQANHKSQIILRRRRTRVSGESRAHPPRLTRRSARARGSPPTSTSRSPQPHCPPSHPPLPDPPP